MYLVLKDLVDFVIVFWGLDFVIVFLGVSSECRFYGVVGMRADSVNPRVLCEWIKFHPETVLVCPGGNDISVNSRPRQTFENIINVVTIHTVNGV